MKHNKIDLSKSCIVTILILMLLAGGCASTSTIPPEEKSPAPEKLKLITDITTGEDPEFFHVTVAANQPLTYTTVRQVTPPGVIFYFPETAFNAIRADYKVESAAIAGIKTSELAEKGGASRIEIQLKKDLIHTVSRSGNGIKISFSKPPIVAPTEKIEKADITKEEAKPVETKVTAEVKPIETKIEETKLEQPVVDILSLPSATKLESIYSVQFEKNTTIKLTANGVIKAYKSFTIVNPPRIVFDMPNLQMAQPPKKEQLIPVNTEWVKSIRYFGYPDKMRIVIDTSKHYINSFAAAPTGNGLQIQVGSDVILTPASATVKEADVKKADASTPQAKPEPPPAPSKTVSPAWVNRIDFSSEPAGKSTLIIGTNQPIQYDIKKETDKRIQLKLINTQLPDYRKRPLITTRFQSAVDRILPFEASTIKDTTLFTIELREAVPYVVEQSDNLLKVHFEASAISPKPLDESKLPAWQTVMTQTTLSAMEPEKLAALHPAAAVPDMKASRVVVEEPITGSTKEYTGEKIALDFYDTDIKNVFRILREVSRKNFAIDKGVAGKVTLTLEQPAPWDQVLDLILKMNGLGMTYEGDIIRIAKQETIEKEQKALQAKLASERKAKRDEQKEEKELEPLVTEYIWVNYANATSEILPKVQPVITKGRGSISVDDRNNQLIVTDVPAVIDKLRDIVRKIDRVTPQVLIEARIIEATNTFTRAIGTQWGVTGQGNDSISNALGGTLGYDMAAVNPPTSTLGTLGINFTRLLGTPFELIDARISASETEGDVNIISAPKILTLNNKKATIKQGVRYPYNKLVDGETRTEFIDVDLMLEVEPLVTPDSRVNMKMKVSNNELGAIVNGQQSFTTKEAHTELLVNDGETIVIGGIRKTTKRNDVSGVPVMKDIPVLGWLFKSKGITDNKEELLIFITPQIVQLEQRGS